MKTMMLQLSRYSTQATLLVAIFFLFWSSQAIGGTVNVPVDAGQFVIVSIKYKNNPKKTEVVFGDASNNAKLTILAQEDVEMAVVDTVIDGVEWTIDIGPLLSAGGLSSHEPFELPGFAAVDPPVRLVTHFFDLGTFLGEGVSFSIGQTVTATNGIIPETSNISFLDGSSLSSDRVMAAEQLLELGVVESLPEFTGEATVSGFVTFTSIPEPQSIVLFGTGLASVGFVVWRRRKAPNPTVSQKST